jgi:hypothetical protein
MITREEINGLIFIAQTTYYIYKSEEDLQKGKATVVCSEEQIFEQNKKLAKEKKKTNEENKFIIDL